MDISIKSEYNDDEKQLCTICHGIEEEKARNSEETGYLIDNNFRDLGTEKSFTRRQAICKGEPHGETFFIVQVSNVNNEKGHTMRFDALYRVTRRVVLKAPFNIYIFICELFLI